MANAGGKRVQRTPQNTDRIARTVRRALTYRYCVRSIDRGRHHPQRGFIDGRRKYRPRAERVGIGGLAGFLLQSGGCGRCGRCFHELYLWPMMTLRVSPSAGAMLMHLASDYIHPYRSAGGRPARCRVRTYLPEDALDAPVVICSELPSNPGGSITNCKRIASP
jgi:hypothetical protein